MKNKIFLIIGFVALLFAACDPLKDDLDAIKKGVDAQRPAPSFDYMLAEDDYKLAGAGTAAASFKSFNDIDSMKEQVPLILASLFPQFGNTASVNLTYAFYNPLSSSKKASSETYTVTDDDYTNLDFSSGRFTDLGRDLDKFLKWRFPTLKSNGDIVNLTFKWRDPYPFQVIDVTNDIVYFDETWYALYKLSDADYASFPEVSDGFDYFLDDAAAKVNISSYMLDLYPTAEDGDIKIIEYNSSFRRNKRLLLYSFNGASWDLKISSNENRTLKFAHNGSVWKPDNTIKYALTSDDFATIAGLVEADINAGTDATFTSKYQPLLDAIKSSLTGFSNFDLRDSKDYPWAESQKNKYVILYISKLLLANFPGAEEGQKYLVTYKYYNGSGDNGFKDIKLILNGGEYVLFVE